MSFWHKGFLHNHMVLGLTYSSRGRTEILKVLHTIWKEQKITRKHTKGLGTVPVFRESIPSSLGHAADEGERLFGSRPWYCTARAHLGSPCLRGKISMIRCYFMFKKQSFKLDFYTGIYTAHPTRGLNKICDTRISLFSVRRLLLIL